MNEGFLDVRLDRLSISSLPVRLADEDPALKTESTPAGAGHANNLERFGDNASTGAEAWPVRHAGNPVARRDAVRIAAVLVPAQKTHVTYRGVSHEIFVPCIHGREEPRQRR